jgi:membrane protein DedA with SNARE-associated domain
MFAHFTQLVSDASGWAYAIVLVLALLDAVIPVVPSETAVITAGVVAAAGDLDLAVVVLVAAVGAFLGDNTAYLIGRRFGTRAAERYFRSEKSRRRIEWTQNQLRTRGGEMIVFARFIPGGRTAVTLSAGTLAYSWRRFAAYDAIAASAWAGYASLLGYFGGRTFEHAAWKGLLLALAVGVALTLLVEAARWSSRKLRASRRS